MYGLPQAFCLDRIAAGKPNRCVMPTLRFGSPHMYRGLSPHSADHVFRTAGGHPGRLMNAISVTRFGDRGPLRALTSLSFLRTTPDAIRAHALRQNHGPARSDRGELRARARRRPRLGTSNISRMLSYLLKSHSHPTGGASRTAKTSTPRTPWCNASGLGRRSRGRREPGSARPILASSGCSVNAIALGVNSTALGVNSIANLGKRTPPAASPRPRCDREGCRARRRRRLEQVARRIRAPARRSG